MSYLGPILSLIGYSYNTRQGHCMALIWHYLAILIFGCSDHKLVKRFCQVFASDTPKICNNLADNIHNATSFNSLRKN